MNIVLGVISTFLSILFVYSGFAKLRNPAAFRQTLLLVPYVPFWLVPVLAPVITVVEILTGLALWSHQLAGQIMAVILLFAFCAITLLAMSKGQSIPCNCFGSNAGERLSLRTVARNLCLILLVWIGILAPSSLPGLMTVLYGLLSFIAFLASRQAAENRRAFDKLISENVL